MTTIFVVVLSSESSSSSVEVVAGAAPPDALALSVLRSLTLETKCELVSSSESVEFLFCDCASVSPVEAILP